jgi:endo-1,4-beta-xylanase
MNKYLLKNFRRNTIIVAAAAVTVVSLTQCSPKQSESISAVPNTTPINDPNKGLKDYLKKYFKVGVAVARQSISRDSALIIKEFNSLTPENDMKPGVLHPSENTWNWKNADDIMAFAERHKIAVRGHNLLWHTQDARWMFTGPDGKPASKELVLQRLRDHIHAVVGRYKGKIYAWDVVNEAVDDGPDSTKIYRTERTPWWTLFQGPEFIDAAFRYAREADPKVKLYYNDYSSESVNKHRKIYKLVKRLKDNGVPIDGVGFQAHWKVNSPTPAALRTALDEIISLGLDVQFTELDVDIRVPAALTPNAAPAATTTPATVPVDPGYTAELEALQIAQYKKMFDVMKEYKKHISSVTFWNVTDRSSWLDNRAQGGGAATSTAGRIPRKAYPLLFDVDGNRKKAYWAVVNK